MKMYSICNNVNFKIFLITTIVLLISIPLKSYADTTTWDSQKSVTSNSVFQNNHEPDIVARTTDPHYVVSGSYAQVSSNPQQCQIFTSIDSSKTWTYEGNLIPKNSADNLVDAVQTSSYDGSIYYSCLEMNTSIPPSNYILMAKSTDGGITWPSVATPVEGPDPNQIDKPWITADSQPSSPYKNQVYVCWTDFTDGAIYFKRSTDPDSSKLAIAHFVNPNLPSQGCTIAIGPTGQVYVAYVDYNTNTIKLKRNFSGGDPFSQWSSTYTVGQWTSFPIISGCNAADCIQGFSNPIEVNHNPSMSTDANGGVHVAWTSYSSISASGDIIYATTNNCQSINDNCDGWNPITISNDVGNHDQWEPALIVSPDNIVHTTVYDRRDDPSNIAYRVYDYHCHHSLVTCTHLSDWLEEPITTSSSSNYDGSPHIDDYHGISTSTSRDVYTAWTSLPFLAQSYDILADTTICTIPPGDWDINSNCTVDQSSTVTGNITVEPGIVLTISSGVTLHIDFSQYKMLINPGGKVLIQPTGMIAK